MEKERKIEAPEGCEIEKVEIVHGAAVITFKKKERKLPKSWEEFCRMYPIKEGEFRIATSSVLLKAKDNPPFDNGEKTRYFSDTNILPDHDTAEAVLTLCQLIQLRNYYNGDWLPDWTDKESKFVIHLDGGKITKFDWYRTDSSPLYFKTKELRDEFLRNFRPLIEKIKPLYGIKKGG